jgi:uncharacterized protein (DUF2147 family)
MKRVLAIFFGMALLLFSCSTETQTEDIIGLWKSRDQKSDRPRSLVAIYKYGDMYYGRMLATYDDQGNINDTILEQRDRAPGVVGNPPYCGMDFIYDLKLEEDSEEDNPKYRGEIIDPEKGKIYKAELWRDGARLIVRGELWIFGKNIPWQMASKEDLPKGFSMKDISKFVPEIPEVE